MSHHRPLRIPALPADVPLQARHENGRSEAELLLQSNGHPHARLQQQQQQQQRHRQHEQHETAHLSLPASASQRQRPQHAFHANVEAASSSLELLAHPDSNSSTPPSSSTTLLHRREASKRPPVAAHANSTWHHSSHANGTSTHSKEQDEEGAQHRTLNASSTSSGEEEDGGLSSSDFVEWPTISLRQLSSPSFYRRLSRSNFMLLLLILTFFLLLFGPRLLHTAKLVSERLPLNSNFPNRVNQPKARSSRAELIAHRSECLDDRLLCLVHDEHSHDYSHVFDPHSNLSQPYDPLLHEHDDPSVRRYTLHDVTIFTTFTPESEHESVAVGVVEEHAGQHESHSLHLHAMYSWRLRIPHASHVLVFVSHAEHCHRLAALPMPVYCRVVSNCFDFSSPSTQRFTASPPPLLTCILTEAKMRSETDLLVFVEDHVIVFADLIPAVLKVANSLPSFVLSGRTRSLSMFMDDQLDLVAWHRDLEHAYQSDSTSETLLIDKQNETPELHSDSRSTHMAAAEAGISDVAGGRVDVEEEEERERLRQGVHYFAYHRHHFDVEQFSPRLLMGGGGFQGHEWESHLLATLLLHDHLPLIDASNSILAVELTHAGDEHNVTQLMNELNQQELPSSLASSASSSSSASALQTLLLNVSGLPIMEMGKLDNAHYQLQGKCPTCALRENREADLPLILMRHANAFKQLIVIAVNYEYLSLAFNWICRAESLGLRNYIFLAEDRVSYRMLRKMNLAVVLRKDAPYQKSASMSGSRAFQETLYLRAIFFHQVVMLGFDLVFSHLDTVWFGDPLPLFQRDAAANRCDLHVSLERGMTGIKAGGGLLEIHASRLGKVFVQEYLQCEYENYLFISLHGRGRFTFSDDPDIDCLELISQRMERRAKLRRCALDSNLFASERDFFRSLTPQKRAINTLVAHLDLTPGVANKTRLFVDWDLWMVDDVAMNRVLMAGSSLAASASSASAGVALSSLNDAHLHVAVQCKQQQRRVPPPFAQAVPRVRFIVNILASTEHNGLNETLQCLLDANYTQQLLHFARAPVDLHVTLQQPEHDTASSSLKHVKTTQIAQSFSWPHGEKRVVYLDAHVGVTAQWLTSWTLHVDADDEQKTEHREHVFQLALTAGMLLSKEWFAYSLMAIREFYLHPFHQLPQLMGLTLTHTDLILGELPAARHGSHQPSHHLARNQTLYFYQHMPFLGTLFFPHHLLSFLHWYHVQPRDEAARACVPTLVSNQWWLAEPQRHWQQWLTRFAFESGWYSLHTHFLSKAATNESASAAPRALLVDGTTSVSADAQVLLIKRMSKRERALLPVHDILLFDFHFRPHAQPHSLLTLRSQYFPPLPHLAPTEHEHQQAAEALERQRKAQRVSVEGARIEAIDSHMHRHEEEGLWSAIERLEAAAERARLREDAALQVNAEVDHEAAHARSHIAHSEAEEAQATSDAERGVTATELIIQLMIAQMQSDGVSGDASMLDADRDDEETKASSASSSHLHTGLIDEIRSQRAQVDAIQRKVNAALLGLSHAHTAANVGLNASAIRCFTVQQLTDTVIAEDPRQHALFNVSTYDLHDMYLHLYTKLKASIDKQVPAIKKKKKSKDEPVVRFTDDVKFVVYSPKHPIPFDGHLRGIYFCFLVALLTDRLLLIDLPEFHLHFSSPWGSKVSWNYRDFDHLLQAPEGVPAYQSAVSTTLQLPISSSLFNLKALNAQLRIDDFNVISNRVQLLVHETGVSLDRVFFMNKLYSAFLPSLFGSYSRMRRTGQTLRFLLSAPKNAIVQASAALAHGFETARFKYTVGVHAITHQSDRSLSAAHLACVRSLIANLRWQKLDTLILISGNGAPSMFDSLHRGLEPYGSIKIDPYWQSGNSALGLCNATHSISTADRVDPYVAYLHLLGEVDVSITSGTTFGIFGPARTGFVRRAYTFKAKPPPTKNKDGKMVQSTEEDYCGPLHRIDLPKENDIAF